MSTADGGAPAVTPAPPPTPSPARSPYPPPKPLFGDRWPAPAAPISGELLGCLAAVGVVAATAVPDGATGVGWLFTASVAVAMTIMVAWGCRARSPLAPADVGWTLSAVALTAVGTVRAADWLAALCLLAAFAAAGLAAARRSFRSLTMSLVAPAVAALRAVPWVARGLRACPRTLLRAAVAALSCLLVLGVFVPLLASADAAFAQVVAAVTPTIDVGSVVRWCVLFGLGTGAAAGGCFLVVAPPPEPYGAVPRPTRLRLLDWALPTGVLVAVLALFVGVQFVVLFGSDGYVLRTTGLTYAEYARSGFWQLLAVTALALGVLAIGFRWAPSRTPVERGAKRGVLAALALLTLVVVASALNRMWLYQQAYGFTVLRLLVLTCELWLGAGFLLALVAVLRLRPGGLSRPMVAVGMLALLGLAALDPERFIAAHNVGAVGRFRPSGHRLPRHPLGRRRARARRSPACHPRLHPRRDRRRPVRARRLAQHQPRPRGRPRGAGPAAPDVRQPLTARHDRHFGDIRCAGTPDVPEVAIMGAERLAEEAELAGPRHGLRAVGHAQLVEQVRDVPLHGVHGDEELLGDGAVGVAARHQREHLVLAGGQRRRHPRRDDGAAARGRQDPGAVPVEGVGRAGRGTRAAPLARRAVRGGDRP